MSQARIDAFTAMLKDQPDNEMIWYDLANEHSKLGNWAEAADALRNVIRLKPDYTSAYQLLGSALFNLGEREEARRVWQAGIAAADRTGAWKARQHMEALLNQTSGTDDTAFCQER